MLKFESFWRKYRIELLAFIAATSIFLTLCLLFGIGFFAKKIPLSKRVVNITSIHTPLEKSPRGLAWSGDVLWISYPQDRLIIAYNPKSMEIVEKIELQNILPLELAWNGKELLVADAISGRIFFLDVEKNEIIGEVENDWGYPTGLTFYNDVIYLYDVASSKLYAVDMKKGMVRSRLFPSVLGLAASEKGLWAVITGNLTISLLDYENLETLEAYYCPTPAPSGLAWDGEYLWLGNFNSGRIYQLKPGEQLWKIRGRGVPSWLVLAYVLVLLPIVFSFLRKSSFYAI